MFPSTKILISIYSQLRYYNSVCVFKFNSYVVVFFCYDCFLNVLIDDFDFILKVITKANRTLEDVLNSIKSISGVSLTRTSVVLSTNKYDICLLEDE